VLDYFSFFNLLYLLRLGLRVFKHGVDANKWRFRNNWTRSIFQYGELEVGKYSHELTKGVRGLHHP
jgi:hypothetical protein